ncbi:pyridoxine biosynthesis protein [Cytospora paraplurivora]|uniref:Pyridoxine biosynthesis protein n=1 Tax=Cytospora paraplurivora TaxID=2898453 RepID=A0AAN9U9E9_9PEZI
MPALSPSMTEGNVAKWKIKEGEKFSAGDVILEIETDKATMDVEAPDDGILFKIIQNDGSKGIKVGARIGVIAEDGDDLSTLEIPADESPKEDAAAAAPKEESKSEPVPQEERTASEPAQTGAKSSAKAQKQGYPLFPSIIQLLHENGIDESKIDEIPATGPKGRLLKGDVLVYLGKAKAESAATGAQRYEKLAHLDLSNIKVAEKKAAPKVEEKPAKPAAPVVEDLQVTLPVSLASVIELQKKVQDTLGSFVPLSTFVARATEVANDNLPLPANYKPSADELFNQILGLDTVGPKGSRGHYLPQISALPPPASFSQKSFRAAKPDIIDILTGGPAKKSAAPKASARPAGLSTGVNVFSLKVPKVEEKRARVFLERVKLVLENEPGRLVL